MNSQTKYQHGYTFMSLVFLLGLIAFFVLLVLKIGPIYMDHSKVVNALAALEKTPDVEEKPEPEIRSILDKRFSMNYVTVSRDDVKIIQSGNYLKVTIEYDVIEKILGNLSVLVEFSDEIEVGQP